MPKQQPSYEPEVSPEYVDEHHEAISTFAETYFDDPEEREAFVGTLMERRGYTRRAVWGPPEETPEPEPEPQQPAPQQRRAPQPKRAPYFKQTR